MRVVLQRVVHARVTCLEGAEDRQAAIARGLVLLAGFCADDSSRTLQWMADKCAGLRVFEDEHGAMNRSLADVEGSILVVPNFTLYGDARKGRRPSFSSAAAPQQAAALFDDFVHCLRSCAVPVQAGFFQTHMQVEIHNDGPVTLFLER